jgi:hypothetical protein
MNGIIIDYHLIFILITFFLFIISVLLLFIESSLQRTTAAVVFIFFGIILCILCSIAFHSIDLYGYTSTGTIVHNNIPDQMDLSMIFYALFFINIMLLVYAGYLFISKPWEESEEGYEQTETEWY